MPTSPADLWPQERSLHSACVLLDPKFYSMTADSFRSTPHSQSCNGPSDSCAGQPQPKLFVLWGTGNSDVELAQDAWILDVNNTTWSPVTIHANSLFLAFHYSTVILIPLYSYGRYSYHLLWVSLVCAFLLVVVIAVRLKLS